MLFWGGDGKFGVDIPFFHCLPFYLHQCSAFSQEPHIIGFISYIIISINTIYFTGPKYFSTIVKSNQVLSSDLHVHYSSSHPCIVIIVLLPKTMAPTILVLFLAHVRVVLCSAI